MKNKTRLGEYDFEVHHIKGKNNVAAAALSRTTMQQGNTWWNLTHTSDNPVENKRNMS